jgi:sugar phosphate isomerase/epimerase
VRLDASGSFHLTYCTNIHAAEGWDAVDANVRRFAPALKQRFSPAAPFGIGLRLSARDARELLEGDRLDRFRGFLDAGGLYVALINGFPHGSFHRTAVKADVYAPDWRDEARVRYTLDLVEILARLLPEDVDGGISTAPLTYKPWMPAAAGPAWAAFTENVVHVAEAMVRLRERRGIVMHLDVEPEPDCLIETTDEFLEFFERRLLPDGAPLLAASIGCDAARARDHLREHVRMCLDCCHYAVEFEDPAEALARIRDAGVRIGRVQLSSALKVRFPDDVEGCRAIVERLLRFADSTYLHQVIERRDGTLTHYSDLDVALAMSPAPVGAEWRIHFHVPLFTAEYDGLGSTQDYVREIITLASASRATRHFEIETYTWDVLPPGLKIDLLDSIGREYEWVLGHFRIGSRAEGAESRSRT